MCYTLDHLKFAATDYWKEPQWNRFPLPTAMTPMEAHFWFVALAPPSRKEVRELENTIKNLPPDARKQMGEALKDLRKAK